MRVKKVFNKPRQAPLAKGICSECNKEANFKLEDFGIGTYEFWGAVGTNHDYQWISECCEAPPVEKTLDPEIPDFDDYPDRP